MFSILCAFGLLNLYAQELINPMFNQPDFSDLEAQNITIADWDSNDLMWFSSEKGISSYNGNSVVHYSSDSTSKNTPISNNIITFKVDDYDKIWISYVDTNAISKFDIANKRFTHFSNENEQLIPKSVVVNFKTIDENSVALCSWGGGFSIFDHKNRKSQNFERSEEGKSSIPVNRVKDIAIINDEKWIITYFENGRIKNIPSIFNPKKKSFQNLPLERYTRHLSDRLQWLIEKNLQVVNFIHVDKYDNYWFGTYSGLIHLNNKDSTANRILVDSSKMSTRNIVNARDYVVDKNGLLWVSTFNSGILLVNQKTCAAKYIKHDIDNFNSLASNAGTTVFNDNLGNTWVNTGQTSFSVYNPYFQNFRIKSWEELPLKYTDQSAQNIPVNQMYTSDEGVNYISSANGLLAYDSKSNQYDKLINTENHPFLNSLRKPGILSFKVHNSKVYHGRGKFLRIFDIKKKQYLEPITVRHLSPLFTHEEFGDTLYFIQKFWRGYEIYSLVPGDSLKSMMKFPRGLKIVTLGSRILPDGRWLLNTKDSGIVLLDPKTWEYISLNKEDKINYFPELNINCSLVKDDENCFLGTDLGLYILNLKSNKVTYVSNKMGLNQQPVKALIYDNKGTMWLALKNKLFKWNEDRKEGFTYSRSTGLKSGDFLPSFGQKRADGKLFFVARNGILMFHPESLEFPSHDFKIQLDELVVNDNDISDSIVVSNYLEGDVMRFNWDENRLAFTFGNNQHFSPTDHEYFYRLKGEHEDWQSNGNSNTIKLSGLGYGTYSLEVKAVNTYNQETHIETINFKIQTPFWLSVWFYVVILIVIILAVILIIKIREKKMVRQKEKLELTVKERTAEVLEKAAEIQSQKDIIETKNIELTDSITYAKRIQDAILPSNVQMNHLLNNSFVYYRPKEIVAGDFYWVEPEDRQEESVYFAVADCTGHGVPGAIVSVICNNALQRTLREYKCTSPDQILNTTRKLVVEEFRKSNEAVKDGMDIALCKTHKDKNRKFNLEFSGANNPLIVLRESKNKTDELLAKDIHGEEYTIQASKLSDSHCLFEIKGDKQPIGSHFDSRPFKNHWVNLRKGDVVFLFSDGYHDQFGSFEPEDRRDQHGKKLKTGNFKKLLLEAQELPFNEQPAFLNKKFTQWMGSLEQIDDVCVFAFKWE